MKKQILLTALTLTLLASAVMTAAAEEAVGTILFEPKQNNSGSYEYSLATNPNSRIADKSMIMNYSNAGSVVLTLPNYLVKGVKIVYENEGMKNTMGEYIAPNRMIAIILEDGTYIELTELVPDYDIAWYLPYLYAKLVREGRAR
jgi:hypothetical protein